MSIFDILVFVLIAVAVVAYIFYRKRHKLLAKRTEENRIKKDVDVTKEEYEAAAAYREKLEVQMKQADNQ